MRVGLLVFAFTAALTAAIGLGIAFAIPAPSKPAPKPALARYWAYPRLAREFGPLKPLPVAVPSTSAPGGWVLVRGCKASTTSSLHRVVLLCK